MLNNNNNNNNNNSGNHLDTNSKKVKQFDRSDLQPFSIVISLVLSTLSLFTSFLILSNISSFEQNSRNQLALVQLQNGKSILASKLNSYERDPELIKNYTKEVFGLLFTWNQDLSTSSNNKGITLSDRSRVTIASWEASFAISENFRTTFLKAIAELTPDEVFKGKAQSVLSFQHISQPKALDRGKWNLTMVANLLLITSSYPEGIRIPFNKTITIEAIEVTTDPIPEETSPIQKAIYNIKQKGLQITEIRDLEISRE